MHQRRTTLWKRVSAEGSPDLRARRGQVLLSLLEIQTLKRQVGSSQNRPAEPKTIVVIGSVSFHSNTFGAWTSRAQQSGDLTIAGGGRDDIRGCPV